jgi:hypothetical protein
MTKPVTVRTSIQASRQAENFLDALWQTAQTCQPKVGIGTELFGHGEWLGVEAKGGGGKVTYYLPSLLEFSIDVSAGVNAGIELPNWFPASVYGSCGASLGLALVGVIDIAEIADAHFEPRVKLSIPAVNLGGRPIPLLELECTHLNIFFNPLQPYKISVYFTAGAGLALPFLPDLGKLLVQLSPKLRVKGELHGILRCDFRGEQLLDYMVG